MAEKSAKTESTRSNESTASRTSSSTLTSDTAALGTATEDGKGTPAPARTLRGSAFGVSGDILNPAFAAPRDEGHEQNIKEGLERASKEQEG